MTKHIELKAANQGTALATGTLALPPLVIEGLEEFKGSFDRLCLQAGTAAIEAMLAAAPFSLRWSQKTVMLSLDSADARIGRPLTPLSVAGAHRRAYRRAYPVQLTEQLEQLLPMASGRIPGLRLFRL